MRESTPLKFQGPKSIHFSKDFIHAFVLKRYMKDVEKCTIWCQDPKFVRSE